MTTTALEKAQIMTEATKCAMNNQQVEPNEERYFITIGQLEEILLSAGDSETSGAAQPAERSGIDYAIEHAGYLADAVDHYLEERNKFDALEVVDVGEQDSLNDHIRALRDCTYEFRKRRARALGATSISKDAEKESARDKFQELRPGLNPDTDPHVARYYRGFELGWVSRALAATPVSTPLVGEK